MVNKKDSFWQHWRYKYRLSILNEDTFTEAWHARLSRMSVFVIMVVLFLVIIALYSVLIFFTPVRNILPGYSASIRQELIEESVRVDSLTNSLDAQTRYLTIVRNVLAGEVMSDTIQSLDSMQIIMREELLEAKSQVTSDFIAQYEEKEKDQLQLLDMQPTTSLITFYRPVQGIILSQYRPEQKQYGIQLQTPNHANVTAVLDGTVVYVHYEIDNTYTLIVQHSQFISIYRQLAHVSKRIGDAVATGENIALTADNLPLYFEIWQDGEAINPEEVIAF